MPKKRKREPMSETIRELIRNAGQTPYAIAKATGVAESTLSRFLSGECGLTTKNLDRLADHLGWRLVVDDNLKDVME